MGGVRGSEPGPERKRMGADGGGQSRQGRLMHSLEGLGKKRNSVLNLPAKRARVFLKDLVEYVQCITLPL